MIWAQGFGYADVEAQRPATADTPYEIASLTKPVSSAVLLRLVEQGRVSPTIRPLALSQGTGG